MSVRTQLAYLAAGLTIVLALLALLNPAFAVRVLGLEIVDPRGFSEIRATYGALFLVLGGGMLWAVPTRPRSAPWLRFGGLLWCGAALGRLLSILIDPGALTLFNVIALAVQALIGAAAVIGSFQAPEPKRVAPDDDIPDPLRAYRS